MKSDVQGPITTVFSIPAEFVVLPPPIGCVVSGISGMGSEVACSRIDLPPKSQADPCQPNEEGCWTVNIEVLSNLSPSSLGTHVAAVSITSALDSDMTNNNGSLLVESTTDAALQVTVLPTLGFYSGTNTSAISVISTL
mgnify:CR=1 FL=1